MKIYLVSSVLPIRGGVASFMEAASIKLHQLEYEVRVINVIGGRQEGFTYFDKAFAKFTSAILNLNIVFLLSFIFARIILLFRFIKEYNTAENSVVHAQDVNAFNALHGFCRSRNVKILLTVHGHLYNSGTATRNIGTESWLSRYLFRQEIKAYSRAKQIITVSDYSYDVVKQYTDANHVYIIRNFVNTDSFYPVNETTKQELRKQNNFGKNELILIYAGRLMASKGVSYILEGLKASCGLIPVKLIIAGDGPDRGALELYTQENGLEEIVKFTGEIQREQLLEFYNLSDVFIMASITGQGNIEGTPMSLLEAMACKLSVITTLTGGIAAVVRNGENALVIEQKSGEDIAQKIKLLYDDEILRKNITEDAYKDVEKYFSLDTVIHEIIERYKA